MRDKRSIIDSLKFLTGLCFLIIAVEIIDILSGDYLVHYGLLPRDVDGLIGIVTAPFLHGDWAHLINNLVGLVIFGFLCLIKGISYFLRASVIIILLAGVLVWLFGRDSYHIGASGWVFGLWSLNIALAWFERSFRSILIAVGVIFFYGSMLFGVLPNQPFISFESHLFGAFAGVFAAGFLNRQRNFPKRQKGELKFWS